MRGSVMEQFDQDGLGNETDEAETEREEQDEVTKFAGFRFLAHFPDDEQHPSDQPADADRKRPGFELFDGHGMRADLQGEHLTQQRGATQMTEVKTPLFPPLPSAE